MLFFKKEKPEYELFMQDAILRSLSIDGVCYVLQDAKIYETKASLSIDIVKEKEDGFHDVEMKKITILRSKKTYLQSFEFEGHTFYWDYEDMTFRYRPDFDKTKRVEINKWVHIVDDKVMWVDKRYAELNLSPLCLRYAYCDDDGNYLWYEGDNSWYTVLLEFFKLVVDFRHAKDEMVRLFYDIANNIGVYAKTYYNNELDPTYLIDYENNKNKSFILKRYNVQKAYDRIIKEI